MEEMNVTIAKALLSIKAVFFRPEEPFIWASGIKSPVYCDNRLILTAPGVRSEVEKALARTVKREYPEAEVLMGYWAFPWAMSGEERRITEDKTRLREG